MTLHTEEQLPDTLIPIYVHFFNNSKKTDRLSLLLEKCLLSLRSEAWTVNKYTKFLGHQPCKILDNHQYL
jgi:hypothetical protein